MTDAERARPSLDRIANEHINSPRVQRLFAQSREFDAEATSLRQRIVNRDLRVRQLELQVSPGFTKHDAFLLVMGAFGAVLFGAVIAYMQGQFL